MAEPEYPIAWGVFVTWPTGFVSLEHFAMSKDRADRLASEWNEKSSVVELIPRPVHERLVAEAVAAERERCAKIIDKAYCANTDEAMRWSRVARKIREVPQ